MNDPRFENKDPVNAREMAVESTENLVSRYLLFMEVFKPVIDVVYYPCCGTDVSPSRAFLKSRVIYVDKNHTVVSALKKAGFETYKASALEYAPEVPVNVLILLNPQVLPEKMIQRLTSGSYVLCNNYHGTANVLRDNQELNLVGILHHDHTSDCVSFDGENLEDYFQEVETEEEFKAATSGSKGIHYEHAADLVQQLTGRKENILAEYKNLLTLAKAAYEQRRFSELRQIQAVLPNATFPPELEENSDFILFETPNGESVELDLRLPKKKGFPTDLFVFKKL